MAKVKAPFLSLGASGKIAGTLVASTWKGLKTMREYVIPSNPKTAGQVTQRGYFSDAVAAFRNYLTNALGRTAWNRSALATGNAQSGFNVAMKNLIKIISTDPDGSFCNSAVAAAGNTIDFSLVNVDDGAEGDEAGNFELWAGTAPASLLLNASDLTIADGDISSGDLGDTDDVYYAKLRKDDADRSGIFKITLTA